MIHVLYLEEINEEKPIKTEKKTKSKKKIDDEKDTLQFLF